jgi:fatty acid desaturase
MVFVVLSLPGIALLCLIAVWPAAALALVFLAGLWFVFCGLVQSALETIFRAGLYTYAQTGKAPDGFDAGELRGAFAPAKTGLID